MQLPHGRAGHRPDRHRVLGVADGYRQVTVLHLTGDGEFHLAVGDVRGQRLVVAKPSRAGRGFPKRAELDRTANLKRLPLGHNTLGREPCEVDQRVARDLRARQTPTTQRV